MPTTITTGSSLAQQNWRAGVIVESERTCVVKQLEGTKSSSCIVYEDRPDGGRGASITMRVTQPNHGEIPITAFANVIGQESGTTYTDVGLVMNYQGFTGGVPNVPVEQNLVSFNLKRGEVGRVARQVSEHTEASTLRQLAGFTGTITPTGGTAVSVNSFTDYVMSAGNPVVAPDGTKSNGKGGKWFLVPPVSGSANTTETGIAGNPSSIFSSRVVDEVLKQWTSRDYVEWPMAPAKTPWGEYFVCLVSSQGYQQFKLNSSQSDYYDLARAEIQGGGGYDNSPLVDRKGLIYDKTIIINSDFLPPGVVNAGPGAPTGTGANQANVKRAVFLGARAGHCTYGSGYTNGNHLGFSEVTLHRHWSILVDTIWGLNRVVCNAGTGVAESFGCGVISHYSDV